jgi:hypothetical protein
VPAINGVLDRSVSVCERAERAVVVAAAGAVGGRYSLRLGRGVLELRQLGARNGEANPLRTEVDHERRISLHGQDNTQTVLVVRDLVVNSEQVRWH